MGDVRFSRIYDRIASAPEPVRVLSSLSDDEVVQALAAASREHDPYLANVLGTEAMNRMRVHGAALTTMNEGLIVLDETGCLTYMNPAAEAMFGWSTGELAGRRLHDVVHAWDVHGRPVDFDACPIMRDVFARRPVKARSDVFTRKGGERLPIEYSSAPIVRDGILEGAVLVVTDTRERQRAEFALRESEERYRSFFANHPDAIFSIGPDARFVAINPAAERISGYPAEEMLGKPFLPLVAEEDLDRVLGAFARVLTGSSETIEFAIVRKDGRRANVVVTGTPMRIGGEIAGVHGTAKDVTFEHGAKAALASRALRQRFLARLGEEVLAADDLSPVLHRAMAELASVLGVDLAKVLELEPRGESLMLRAGHGWRDGLVGIATVGTGLDSQAGFTLAVGGPVVVYDLPTEARFSGPPLLREHDVVSGMSVVIRTPASVYGVLGVHTTRPRAFSTEDVDFLVSVANVIGFAIDRERSDRERAENDARMRILFDGVREHAIILVGQDGRIERWNSGAESIFAVPASDAESKPFVEFFPPEARAAVRDGIAAASRDGRHVATVVVRPGGAEGKPAEMTTTALPDGEGRRGFAIILRRLAPTGEDALKRAKADLEARARERSRELALAHQDLEAFSYTVAHDLRAPLRGIEYFSGLLVEDHAKELGEEGREILARLRSEATRGSRLVSDLLDLAQVKRAPLVVEDLDFSTMAEEIARDLSGREPDRRVRWKIEPGLRARGDPQLLRQVFDNLIGNAWKYTAGRDDATIAVGARDEAGTRVYEVADNGAGFDPRRAAELFKPFARLHTRSEFEGTGVGLAIVARIVERHGGRVAASSPGPGRGATMSFTLG
ncbi:MAG TPA: PAS domain S-box protein [Candidatus Thermoplasmatota archaeon]|nr:PAS domain S-box protein [Candidatus Thermoplasmatota archaeon]